MEGKLLGKISSAQFGFGGYDGAMMGFWMSFNGDGWGVTWKGIGTWASERTKHTEWTEEDRRKIYADAVERLCETLKKAKRNHVGELAGVPVECEFVGNVLHSWRVLEEVL